MPGGWSKGCSLQWECDSRPRDGERAESCSRGLVLLFLFITFS